MLESVKNQIENLDLIAADFIQTNSQVYYSKDKIVELDKTEKLILQFNFIIVAISKNGGLIALCKTKGYYELKGTKINDNIIVMHQNAKTRYYIPIDWDYNARHIVSMEFNEKEQLYAFCNDGTLFKIDILTQKARDTGFTNQKIKSEGISKAKLFEKGYIVLTEKGSIYLIEDIKNGLPQFIISIKEQLHFTNDIDFIGIPANKTCSKKFEILITNQKGEGVLHVKKQDPSGDNKKAFQFETKNDNKKDKTVNVFLLNSSDLEKYEEPIRAKTTIDIQEKSDSGFEVVELESKLKDDFEPQFTMTHTNTKNKIGKVAALAISPSQDYIALYVSESNTIFYLTSEISQKNNKIDKLKFELDYSLEDSELKEQQTILNYETEQQLLFCGDEAVAICGGKYIMMINKKNETIPIIVSEEEGANQYKGQAYCKCISEVDGIRFLTDKEIYLISPVPYELSQICNPFSESLTRELVNAYGNFLSKNPSCNDQIRKIGDNLPNTIKDLSISAAHIYWNQQDPDTFTRRDIQSFMLKAAQFGKSFVGSDVFNFDRFNDICKSIRIINNMRNDKLKPRYLTYNEYLDMNPDFPNEIINKAMRQLNYKLAHEICKFLGDEEKHIFLRYAIAKIKKLPTISDLSAENKVYNDLMKSFENVDNISFIEIAKKCIKYKKYDLAERFLKNEKSILVKIPQYLELGNWEKALELSLKSCDLNVIRVVIDKIYKVLEQRDFNEIFAKFPQAHSAVINYYKSIGKYDELEKYLNYQKDQEELLFISLENFFKSQTLEERKKYIDEAKKCLSGAKNIDYSFYKVYISDLANSLKVKEQCFDQDRNILEKNDITTFDNSMYDCFQKAKSKNYSWIESQNKKYFEISRRKMTILRFRTLLKEKLNGEKAEIDQIDQIDQIIKKEGYKRLDISPLKVANIFYEFLNSENIIKKNKEIIEMKATEYALLETNPDLYEDKFAFLMRMEKYIEAVQAALSNKKNEKMYTFINNVLKKKPELRTKIQELCDKNKVRL
jgi:hypothetical protein